ncbi:MAG: SIMPL domain-containing protein [Gammaproteobacteria bacterium]|nr:SIMPL domain-containing protein [Gammaproteobacteria bacterium]
MDQFIEVIGSSTLTESVSRYRAQITLSVRAASRETAGEEALDLRDKCVSTLREAGLIQTEIQEGGSEIWRPWFLKKQAGQETSFRLLISCDEMERLYRALGELEHIVADKKRHTISVSMNRPVFAASEDDRRDAQRCAISAAKEQAEVLAAEAGLRLLDILQIEQLQQKYSRSGAFGDEDWGFLMVGSAEEADAGQGSAPLETTTRETTVSYRVRFGASAP